ncbi:gamma-interferon-inducible lysosomal thiol reductase-like [Diorhabda sublineata]|uniref:gamma-interferon-inducible lysosomal thiol reductase-like n=1 Tax=Diorhabda sublineata TaxID=1163346 RepID=UPI0024E1907A|nr:gamma-interferon-inducible lysosomal thiol reductase-like [Diorhabda sublineata]
MFFIKNLCFLIFAFCIGFSIQDPVKLELYYEGLCTFCHQFIADQLYPTYEALGSDADATILIDLIPYGNAEYVINDDGSVEFDCQHGERECLLNRIHACAINQNTTQAKMIGFIYCSIDSSKQDALEVARECSNEIGLSFDDINSCVYSTQSDNLLLAYAKRQEKLDPPLTYVPNIRFNGVFDENLENNARQDCLATICGLIKESKPKACDSVSKSFRGRSSQ